MLEGDKGRKKARMETWKEGPPEPLVVEGRKVSKPGETSQGTPPPPTSFSEVAW